MSEALDNWSKVVNSPDYVALDQAQKERVQARYFDRFMAPGVPADKVDATRARWLERNRPTVTEAPAKEARAQQFRKIAEGPRNWREVAATEGTEALDYLRMFGAGSGDVAIGIGKFLDYASETLGVDISPELDGKSLEQIGQETVDFYMSRVSPAMRAALEKKIVDENWNVDWGALASPTLGGMLFRSLPLMGISAVGGILGAKAGMAIASMRLGAAAAEGAKIGAALKGATIGGAIGGGISEGALSGALVASELEQAILQAPENELVQSPRYQELRLQGVSKAVARAQVAREAGQERAIKAGAVTAILGAPFGAYVGRVVEGLGGKILSSVGGRLAAGAAIEGGSEMAQSASESYQRQAGEAEHLGRPISIPEIANEALLGAAAGAVLGGTVGGAGPKQTREEDENRAKVADLIARAEARRQEERARLSRLLTGPPGSIVKEGEYIPAGEPEGPAPAPQAPPQAAPPRVDPSGTVWPEGASRVYPELGAAPPDVPRGPPPPPPPPPDEGQPVAAQGHPGAPRPPPVGPEIVPDVPPAPEPAPIEPPPRTTFTEQAAVDADEEIRRELGEQVSQAADIDYDAQYQRKRTRAQIDYMMEQLQTMRLPKYTRGPVDAEIDDAVTAIAKLGGLDRKEMGGEIDPALFKEMRRGPLWVFPKEGGKSLDGMREALVEEGYLTEQATEDDVVRLIEEAQRGKINYSMAHSIEYAPPAWFVNQWANPDLRIPPETIPRILEKVQRGEELPPRQRRLFEHLVGAAIGAREDYARDYLEFRRQRAEARAQLVAAPDEATAAAALEALEQRAPTTEAESLEVAEGLLEGAFEDALAAGVYEEDIERIIAKAEALDSFEAAINTILGEVNELASARDREIEGQGRGEAGAQGAGEGAAQGFGRYWRAPSGQIGSIVEASADEVAIRYPSGATERHKISSLTPATEEEYATQGRPGGDLFGGVTASEEALAAARRKKDERLSGAQVSAGVGGGLFSQQAAQQDIEDQTKGTETPPASEEPAPVPEEPKRELDVQGREPNKFGVYQPTETVAFPKKKSVRGEAEIRLVELEGGEWLMETSVDHLSGDMSGRSAAPSANGTRYASREEALRAGAQSIIDFNSRTYEVPAQAEAAAKLREWAESLLAEKKPAAQKKEFPVTNPAIVEREADALRARELERLTGAGVAQGLAEEMADRYRVGFMEGVAAYDAGGNMPEGRSIGRSIEDLTFRLAWSMARSGGLSGETEPPPKKAKAEVAGPPTVFSRVLDDLKAPEVAAAANRLGLVRGTKAQNVEAIQAANKLVDRIGFGGWLEKALEERRVVSEEGNVRLDLPMEQRDGLRSLVAAAKEFADKYQRNTSMRYKPGGAGRYDQARALIEWRDKMVKAAEIPEAPPAREKPTGAPLARVDLKAAVDAAEAFAAEHPENQLSMYQAYLAGVFNYRDRTRVDEADYQEDEALHDAYLAGRAAAEAGDLASEEGAAPRGGGTPPKRERAEQPPEQPKSKLGAAIKKAAADFGKKNTLFTKESFEAADKDILDSLKDFNVGINPKLLQAVFTKVGYYVEGGLRAFADIVEAMVSDYGDRIVPFLKGAYLAVRNYPGFDNSGMSTEAEIDAYLEARNAPGQRGGVERDSGEGPAQDRVGQEDVSPEPRGPEQSGGGAVPEDEGGRVRRPRGGRVSGGRAASSGARGAINLLEPDGTIRPESGTAGSADTGGGGAGSGAGVQPEPDAGDIASETPEPSRGETRRVVHGDPANIKATIPILMDSQVEDIKKAEVRFFERQGVGILFTNGTGTGKTLVGIGIAKRMALDGRPNILVLAPNTGVIEAWQSDSKLADFQIRQLDGINDSGKDGETNITTYENFYQNDGLVKRSWDLVIADESHNIMSGQEGTETERLHQFRMATRHPSRAESAARVFLAEDYAELDRQMEAAVQRFMKEGEPKFRAEMRAVDELREERAELDKRTKEMAAELVQQRPKVVFLSATPFAHVKTVDYAEGYLFDYSKVEGKGYNQPGGRELFFIQHFGWRMRTGKLTEPEAEVDQLLMARRFHHWLEREGSLSTRSLVVDRDYSRQFIEINSKAGTILDNALTDVFAARDDAGNMRWRKVAEVMSSKPYHHPYWPMILEALKAKEIIPRIKQHLALGRKVVVFHAFRSGHRIRHPFHFPMTGDPQTDDQLNAFMAAHPEAVSLDMSPGSIKMPYETLMQAFGEKTVAVVRGGMSKRKKDMSVADFNDPKSPIKIILVQKESGKEGISLHDKIGDVQRAEIFLYLPDRPVDQIQAEGRIYRTGVKSNAVYEYAKLGLRIEERVFAEHMSAKQEFVENVAMGNAARDLARVFVDSYTNSVAVPPSLEQGVGGKEADRRLNEDSPFQQAKSFYWANKKGRSQEGVDYFATPEPIGYKMVEWLQAVPNSKLLEPSAGHGAIARFFPDDTNNTVVEPSYELQGKLKLNARTTKRFIEGRFEGLDVSNKFSGIAMNPPYGTQSKTAWEHVQKALEWHLRNGGRLVVVRPDSELYERRQEKWEETYAGLVQAWKDGRMTKAEIDRTMGAKTPPTHFVKRMSIRMPAVMFERAGTQVRTVIDVWDRIDDENVRHTASTTQKDLSSIETIGELFDRLENMDAPNRYVQADEMQEATGETQEEIRPPPAQPGPKPKGSIVTPSDKTYTSKDGRVFHQAQMGRRISKEGYDRVKNLASKHGGFWGRVTHMWMFKTPAERDAFVAEAMTVDEGAPFLKRDTAPGPGMTVDDVEFVVKRATRGWKGGPTVRVVADFDAAPPEIGDHVRRVIGRAGKGSAVPGFYDPASKTVWLFADQLQNPQQVRKTLMHEAVGHYGIMRILGKRWGEFVSAVQKLKRRDKKTAALAQEIYETYGYLEASEETAEILAHMAENEIKHPLVVRLMAALRRFLRKLGFNIGLSRTELQGLVLASMDAIQTGWGIEHGDEFQAHDRPVLSRQYTPEQEAAILHGAFGRRPVPKGVLNTIRYYWQRDIINKSWRQGTIDQFDSIRSILKNERAWMMAQLTKGHVGALEVVVRFAGIKRDPSGAIDVDDSIPSLIDILRPLGEEVDDFFIWIAGNRAERLLTEGRERRFDPTQIAALKSLNQGTMADGRSRRQVYDDVLREFQRTHNSIVKIAVQTGMVSREDALRWAREGFYVPFYRMVEEEAQGPGGFPGDSLVNLDAYKKLKGADLPIEDLLGNTMLNWNHMLSASLNNQAGRRAISSAVKMGIAQRIHPAAKTRNSVYVRQKGRRVWYDFGPDPESQIVLDALMALNYEGLNNWPMQAARAFKRVFTTFVTTSPEFRVRNLIRDSLQVLAVTGIDANPFANIKQGFLATSEKRALAARMLASGAIFGESGYTWGGDPEAARHLVEELKARESPVRTPQDALKMAWHWWQRGGARFENVNRAAHFEQNLNNGSDLLEAAFEARDHIDFSRHGGFLWMRVLTQSVAFLNARIQGLDKLYRSAKDPQQKMRFWTVVGAYVASAIALMLAFRDDEDYKSAPDWAHAAYHLLPIGPKDTMIYIPRPFELGAMGYLAERALAQWTGPEGREFGNAVYHTLSETLSFNPIPQIFKPIIEVGSNRSFFTERPIESPYMHELSPQYRRRVYTSELAVAASEILNAPFATTNDKGIANYFRLSPLQVEHLVRGYLGYVGGLTLATGDMVLRPVKGPVRPEWRVDDYALVGAFVKETPLRSTRYESDFYEALGLVRRLHADIRSPASPSGRREAREDLGEEDRAALKHRKPLERTARRVSEINATIRRVYENDNLTAAEKKERIDRLEERKDTVMRRALRRVAN